MHLLYVDDDRINLMLFANACLGVPGLRLSTAADGVEALALARTDPPQMMVIDLNLPDTDGHALLQQLRSEASLADVPAFLCSADNDPALRLSAQRSGFAACWPKPMDAETLRRELSAHGVVVAG